MGKIFWKNFELVVSNFFFFFHFYILLLFLLFGFFLLAVLKPFQNRIHNWSSNVCSEIGMTCTRHTLYSSKCVNPFLHHFFLSFPHFLSLFIFLLLNWFLDCFLFLINREKLNKHKALEKIKEKKKTLQEFQMICVTLDWKWILHVKAQNCNFTECLMLPVQLRIGQK